VGRLRGRDPRPRRPTTGATGATGQVWGSSMLAAPGGSAASSGWTTRNFAIRP
jgi:hypothetical protein